MSGAGKAEHRREAVRQAIEAMPRARHLLAVSGGRDSMVLLDAFARWRDDAVAVATFDHGTGPSARSAARLVEAEAEQRGLPVVSGSAGAALRRSEASWRAARWEFLRGWARALDATVVTAHTRDDQIETVVMRALRDPRHTGARGLAGMLASSRVARPLLDIGRDAIARYARARSVPFREDPSNANRSHLRNRVRLDLLPALERAHPGFGRAMLAISRRAGSWRAGVETLVDRLGVTVGRDATGFSLAVPVDVLCACSCEGLSVLWPAIAARVGVALDWRGLERLVEFTTHGKQGGRVPLSGGAEVQRTATTFVVRASGIREPLYS